MDILTIIATWPLWIQTIAGLIVIIGVPNILNIVNMIRKPKEKKVMSDNPHKDCPYLGDKYFMKAIEPYINKAIDKAVRIFDIKEHQTLDAQMSLVDRSIIKIKSMLIKDFMEIDDLKRDRRAYTMLLNYTLNVCKDELKRWIKENHLLQRTDEDFRSYVEDTALSIQDLHVQQLNTLYESDDYAIDREKLFKHNKESNMREIKEEIEDLLYKIREVAKEKEEEIKRIEND